MKKLLIVLSVLVLVALGLDRGGLYVAERAAGSALQDSQQLRERPDVEITGFPFLDQFASGEYDRVRVSARDVPLGEDAGVLRADRVELVLTGVSSTRDLSRIDVERARADAVISYDDLGAFIGIDLAYSGEGAIVASRIFTVLGQDVEPMIIVEPEIVDGALGLGRFTVNGAADAVGLVTDALEEVFAADIPLQGLPFDIDVDDVRAERDGLHLELSGSDLRFTSTQ